MKMQSLGRLTMHIEVLLENTDGDRGIWVSLPATRNRFEKAVARIGGGRGNFVIADYHVEIPCLSGSTLMRTPLAVVNHFASRMKTMSETDIVKFSAALFAKYIGWSDYPVEQFIDFTYEKEQYTLLTKVYTDKKLRAAVKESQMGVFAPQGYIIPKKDWRETPKRRAVPAALNLLGYIGEDLYGDWDNEIIF